MRILVLLMITLMPQKLVAHSFYYAIGESNAKDRSNTKKLGVIINPGHNFTYFKENNLYWAIDISSASWQNLYGPDIKTGSIVPVILYPRNKENSWWYVKLGIGAAYVNQTRWGNRRLGDNWMFEEKVEIGTPINKHHNLALSFSHYSNAQTNKHNDGLNIVSLVYQYNW